jgi:hypothetical protein
MSSQILLVEGSEPSTPASGKVIVYAKSDGHVYTKDDAGTESSLTQFGKNVIIGGDFSTNPWQRGQSFSSVASGTYTADRFEYAKSGAMVHDVTRSADGPSVAQCGALVTQCLMIDCGTVDASLAAGDYCRITQYIEGYNFLPLAQKPINLSFWHKHTKTGTYCVSVRNSGGDRSFVAEYTQAVSDAWEKATIPILASPAAGTWDYTNGIGLRVDFCLAAGSTFQTTADAWQTGNYFATSNQVNATDSTANNFRLARIQLEPGEYATEFENRTVQQELILCQRYFEKTYAQGTDIGATTHLGSQEIYITGLPNQTYTGSVTSKFAVVKRATPTLVGYSLTSGTAGKARDYVAGADVNVSFGNTNDSGTLMYAQAAGASTTLDLGFHWTADAEL